MGFRITRTSPNQTCCSVTKQKYIYSVYQVYLSETVFVCNKSEICECFCCNYDLDVDMDDICKTGDDSYGDKN